jgi:hypothetical protein
VSIGTKNGLQLEFGDPFHRSAFVFERILLPSRSLWKTM